MSKASPPKRYCPSTRNTSPVLSLLALLGVVNNLSLFDLFLPELVSTRTRKGPQIALPIDQNSIFKATRKERFHWGVHSCGFPSIAR